MDKSTPESCECKHKVYGPIDQITHPGCMKWICPKCHRQGIEKVIAEKSQKETGGCL